MLETLRKQGASVLIYVMFGILIAGFVINFGPQDGSQGCRGASPDTVLTVDGQEVGQPAWRHAFNLRNGHKAQKAEAAMEELLRRELLAQEGERRGLVVPDNLVDRKIKEGEIYLIGIRWDLDSACESGRGPCYFRKEGDQWFFDFKTLQAFLSQMGLSMGHFKTQQQREILADMVADDLRNSANASRDEAQARFLHENTTVTFEAVQFNAGVYGAALRLTSADVERFLASHEADVKKKFDADARSWKGVKAQAHLRQVFVARQPATPPADGAVPGVTPPPAKDPGETQLEGIRADITAGKQTFAAAAAAHNDTEASRALAGDLGWRTVDSPSLPSPALNDAIKTLAAAKAGEVSPVISTPRGFYLLTVEGNRQGDLTFDQVKQEIATDVAREVWGKEAAKRAAIAGLEQARAGKGQNLSELFPRAKEEPNPGINGLENLSPEEREKLMEQIRQMQMQQHGASEWESKNIPAAWTDDPTAPAAGGGAATAPAAEAAPTAAADTHAKPGDAKATDVKVGAPVVVAAPVTASNDVLPALGELAKPELQRHGPAVRDPDDAAGIKSKELVKALFDELTPGNLAPRVYEAGDSYVLAQVVDKRLAKIDDFEKDAAQKVADLAAERGEKVLQRWLADRCGALVASKKISFRKELVTETDDQGKPLRMTYQPCQSMR